MEKEREEFQRQGKSMCKAWEARKSYLSEEMLWTNNGYK